jgi:hypothetical protein
VTEGFLAARFEYPIRLTEHAEVISRLAELVARPCFAPLQRVWKTRKSKNSAYAALTAATVADYLSDGKNHYVGMDGGRSGEMIASARFPTGEHDRDWNVEKPRYMGYIIVPHDASVLAERVAILKEMASVLHILFGGISFEAEFGDAHSFVLVNRPYGLLVSVPHRRERRAHELYGDQIDTKVPGHLTKVSPDSLAESGAFTRVDRIRDDLVYLQLTADPEDARDLNAFEARLDAARAALEPISMDLSSVTFS